MTKSGLYETDFYAWAQEQAALLRQGRFSSADMEHIAEEIDSMGRTEKRELVSRLTVVLLHLLKWQYQPALRGASWRISIEEQRYCVDEHLADNPSLKSALDEVLVTAYKKATMAAERETGMPRKTFPAVCPWTYEQIMDENFWPE